MILKHLHDDPQHKRLFLDFRVDLSSSSVKTLGAGRYVVATYSPPKAQVGVVYGIIPYAMERTDVGNADESMQLIDPLVGNGFFSFEPLVNNNTPIQIEQDYNVPQIASSTPNNNDRAKGKGLTWLSRNVYQDALQAWDNPFFAFLVPAGATLNIVFSLMQYTALNSGGFATTGRYQIGTGTKRVDFAGVVITGVQVPEHALAKR